jgi:AcrR family transcriptional regulator
MTRWPSGSRQRLSDAALQLFAEQGYAATTVDDVAAAAGVTQRTFFRHFRDKEEVVFADDDRLLEVLLDGVRGARSDDAADALRSALHAIAEELEPLQEPLRLRAGIIATDVALTGRELTKQTRWKDAVADALRGQGYDPARADLLAHVGFAVFRHAQEGWLAEDTGPGLGARVDLALAELARVFTARA